MGSLVTVCSRLFAALLLCALASGCGGDARLKKTYPVKGQVFYQDKPAAGATVLFHSKDRPDDPWLRPRGTVDDEGFFTLTSYKVNDGVPAGSYAVTIIWAPKGYKGRIIDANMLPEKYSNKETSELIADVKARNENNLEPFKLHD